MKYREALLLKIRLFFHLGKLKEYWRSAKILLGIKKLDVLELILKITAHVIVGI